MNRTLTALACVLFALAGFVVGKRTAKGEIVTKGQPQLAAPGPTLAQQKMCSDQARLKFHEDNPHPREFDAIPATTIGKPMSATSW